MRLSWVIVPSNQIKSSEIDIGTQQSIKSSGINQGTQISNE